MEQKIPQKDSDQAIRIYNSLSRQKEPFETINKNKVRMYVCGPTVYDQAHIGHARSAYIFDVIRRYLNYKGYDVTFVRNVTDVDDKIIDKAKKEFPEADLKEAVRKVSDKYLASYHGDMGLLGIMPPDREPKATEYISKMVKFIEELIKRGVAYLSEGDVYFDIKKAKDYGKLSNQSLEKMEVGARIAPGEKKRGGLDFALWKAAKENEPSWPSPWGPGRPGWHIECSVMSSDILGDEFDIHGGGIDLIFPHHENEIAQSEGAGKRFARYWLHNGLLTINSEKMAKSLGNFITIKDFIEKYKDADLLKLLFLTTHYRHPVDYTGTKIEEMKNAKTRVSEFFGDVGQMSEMKKMGLINRMKLADAAELEHKFVQAMDDDFNTSDAMGVIFDMVTLGNAYKLKDDIKSAKYIRDRISDLSIRIFGISFDVLELIEEDIKKLIKERDEARLKKDYKKSDEIRKTLGEKGIILKDTKDGTVWRRKI